jgi:hypothetical protein
VLPHDLNQGEQMTLHHTASLTTILVTFAAWRTCDACGVLTLYVDEDLRNDTPVICSHCNRTMQNARLLLSARLIPRLYSRGAP